MLHKLTINRELSIKVIIIDYNWLTAVIVNIYITFYYLKTVIILLLSDKL